MQATVYVFRHEGIGPLRPKVGLSAGTLRFKANLTLAQEATRAVVRFDALGGCKILLTDENCGV